MDYEQQAGAYGHTEENRLNKKVYCEDCGADLTFDTHYTFNGHIYCADCAENAADEDWQGFTVQEKITYLGGEYHYY